ncbi:MAG TPA: hypothetical protein H9883_05055 [Candidatus Ruthenibacterium merdigallinarum]|nr:hypothetical protein [Candidatus Ruthenibacterium merdigallinarum]
MFTKLIRLEMRAAARILVPVYLAALALSGACALAFFALRGFGAPVQEVNWAANHVYIGVRFEHAPILLQIAAALALMLLQLVLVGGVAAAQALAAVRFYRLLGDESAFYFALPATAAQHLGARLVCAVAWSAASLAVAAAAMGLLVTAAVGGTGFSLAALLPAGWGGPAALFLLAALCALAYVAALVQLSCVIGARFERRLIASVAAFAGIGIATELAGGVLAVACAFAFAGRAVAAPMAAVQWVFGALALGLAACAACAFFAARRLLRRRAAL